MSAAEARKARFILAERRWRIDEAQIFVAVLGFRRLASIPATARSVTTVSGAVLATQLGCAALDAWLIFSAPPGPARA